MESSRCKAFLASAEYGSFTKAAEHLHYTPSGVSQLVAALEDELGFVLFLRAKRGVTLTDAGERLLPAIRSFLTEEQRIEEIAAGINGLTLGEIRIASLSSISTHWLPRLIRFFRQDYPDIRIRLLEGVRGEVVDWLSERKADIGFLNYFEDLSAYHWIPLAKDRMLAILPKSHPLAQSKRYPVKRCSGEEFIMPSMGWDEDIIALFEKFGIQPDIRYTTAENYAAIAMVENEMGMSIMNELITLSFQADVVKLPLNPPQIIEMGMALPSLTQASPAVRKFVEYAERYLKELATVT